MNKIIYIIDDDPIFRFIVESMMGRIDEGLSFIHCENGNIGLEQLSVAQAKSSNCIVLLDLNMPVLDGWDFLDEVQSGFLKDYQLLDIYILSSSTDQNDIEKAKQYSFVKKFYHKPLSKDDIISVLNS